jgi:single-strand DNA-binding protein
MSGFQNCVVYGNVGKDPEITYTANGTKLAKFSLAVNRVWRDKQGQKQDETTWFRCEVWGEKQADVVESYVHKGDPLLVQGEIRTYQFEGKDGNTVYGWNLNVQRLQLMGRKSEDSGRPQGEMPEGRRKAEVPPVQAPLEDDIPF